MYSLNKSYLYQRHYNIDCSQTVYEYVVANMNKNKDLNGIYYVFANKGITYEINLLGSLIIEFIKQGSSINEITNELLTIYKVGPEKLKTDITNFIIHLQRIGIIVDV